MLPIRKVALEELALERVALPNRKVRILDAKLRQHWQRAGDGGFVQRLQLPKQYWQRPGISDDVVQRQYEQVARIGEPTEDSPHERAMREVKSAACLLGAEGLRRRRARRHGPIREIDDGQ